MLIESLDTQISCPEVLTTSDIKVPSRILAVVNVHIHLKTVHKRHIYDVQPSQVHADDHSNIVLIPTIYKLGNTSASEIPCVFINLSTEDIHLNKGEIKGFLIEITIKLDEITTMTVYDTPFYEYDFCLELVS